MVAKNQVNKKMQKRNHTGGSRRTLDTLRNLRKRPARYLLEERFGGEQIRGWMEAGKIQQLKLWRIVYNTMKNKGFLEKKGMVIPIV
ncbi:hypothetical protein LINGRAHAP2_LOCUS31700 [Linum grandiflorum]